MAKKGDDKLQVVHCHQIFSHTCTTVFHWQLKHCLPSVCCYSSASPPPPQLQHITSTPNYTCCNTSPPMLQVIQSTPGGVTSRRGSPTPPQCSRSPTPQPSAKRGRGRGRGRGTGRRRLPSLSPTRQLSRSPSHRSHQRRSQDNTQQNPTQDDHSADSPIVGSFQVPVNLNESSLSLFDTTPYNAKIGRASCRERV